MEIEKKKILFLTEADLLKAGVLNQKHCVEVMDETFKLLGKGDYIMGGPCKNDHGIAIYFPEHPEFEGMPCDGPDRRFFAMPAYLGGRFHATGVKWYGSNIANPARGLPRSILTLILNDPDTCEPYSIMSANLISAMRTGSVPGVGVKYLGRQDAEVVSCIGCGPIARGCLKGISAVAKNLKRIVVYDIKLEAATKFIAFAKEELELEGEIADSAEAAIRDGDIISFAASAQYPTNVKYEWLKKGSLSILTGGAVFDDESTEKATIVFDNPAMFESWSQEPEFKHNFSQSSWWKYAREGKTKPIKDQIGLGSIAFGMLPGRTSDEEIIVLQTGGMPIEDVAWGSEMYAKAREMRLGQEISFWDEPHWY